MAHFSGAGDETMGDEAAIFETMSGGHMAEHSDQPDSSRGTKRKADAADEPSPPPPRRRIRPLDQQVVNKIAAGEIIVAPVHALKELIENAVDAGATSLEIVVKEGGLKLLQITDNGHGIDQADLPVLCERFTTSKLTTFEDLTSIGTYGFRGEALASISHIAHLQVTTRTQDSSCAWRAHYGAGKLVPAKPGQSSEPKATAGRQGTQITVEDLFYNVPTRRRAFRSASEEYNKILDLVGRYAVHCSGVAFTCKKAGDASMGITVQARANAVERIRQIHGSPVANELIQFEAADDQWGFKSNGWISNANYTVKKTALLLFINHRSVENTNLKRAVEQVYATYLPKGGHPFVYLSLDIDPKRLDVNVHPTKREVNFLNEDEIIEVICEEIASRLGQVDTSRTFLMQSLLPGVKVPTISADTTNSPVRSTPKQVDANQATSSAGQRLTLRTPASRPYENNLVRTDSKIRKITSMFQHRDTTGSSTGGRANDESMPEAEDDGDAAEGDDLEYIDEHREHVTCRLASVKELRAEVRERVNENLARLFASHTFVGVVDERRRILALQAGVKLYLVDYGMILHEYFYQVGLTDFGNFGMHRLEPALNLRELLSIGAEEEERQCSPATAAAVDWDAVVDEVAALLLERREMLREYFAVDITTDGQLQSLPLLVKGYLPSMAKLPRFLLSLGPRVDWQSEKTCFETFLRELAAWYTPERLPPSEAAVSAAAGAGSDGAAAMVTREQTGEEEEEEEEKAELAARRAHVHAALEHALLPALRSRLVAVNALTRGVVEVADLKGLYRVFERC